MNLQQMFGSSKQVATFAILILMSMVLSFIEITPFPGVEWLKYDPSGIVVAFTALLYGPWQGIAIAILSWIPHLTTGLLGAVMNIMASAAMALVLGSIFRRSTSAPATVAAVLGSALAAVVVSVCLNFVVTPLYLSTSYEQVLELVIPYLVPFNAAKALINALVALVGYHKLHRLLSEGGTAGDSSTGRTA